MHRPARRCAKRFPSPAGGPRGAGKPGECLRPRRAGRFWHSSCVPSSGPRFQAAGWRRDGRRDLSERTYPMSNATTAKKDLQQAYDKTKEAAGTVADKAREAAGTAYDKMKD